jgi:hypothetical protein
VSVVRISVVADGFEVALLDDVREVFAQPDNVKRYGTRAEALAAVEAALPADAPVAPEVPVFEAPLLTRSLT